MRKIINLFLVIVLFLTTIGVAFAEDKLNLVETLMNLTDVPNYTVNETITFNIEMDEARLEFRLNLQGQVDYSKTSQPQSVLQINGFYNVVKTDVVPNENISGNFRGNMIFLFKKGFYFRLNELNLNTENAKSLSKKERNSIEAVLTKLDSIKNQWYFLPLSSDINNFTNIQRIQDERSKLFLEQKYIRIKEILQGPNKGFRAFSLDKKAIFVDSGKFDREKNTILSRLDLFGRYHINSKYNIYDDFFFKIHLRDIEKIKLFDVDFRFRITKINETETVMLKAPVNFKSFNELIAIFQSISDKK